MKEIINHEIEYQARKIKLLLMDCDGVLTDGRLYFSEKGEELKVFHVRDGQGIVMWHEAGFESGIISGRSSKILITRATELGIRYIKVGSQDKVKDFEQIFEQSKVEIDQVAYIGDDIPDLSLMKIVGFPITVNDAVAEIKPFAKHITKSNGGYGAVREVIDFLINTKNHNLG